VIVISAINTIISVGVQSFLAQPIISITNCILSAICGIIVSVKLYLAIQTQMELELSTSKDFYTLSVDIYKTISLAVPNRGVDGVTFLNTNFQTYSDLVQKSSILLKKLNDRMVPDKILLYNSSNVINNSNLEKEVIRASRIKSDFLSNPPNDIENSIINVNEYENSIINGIENSIENDSKI